MLNAQRALDRLFPDRSFATAFVLHHATISSAVSISITSSLLRFRDSIREDSFEKADANPDPPRPRTQHTAHTASVYSAPKWAPMKVANSVR